MAFTEFLLDIKQLCVEIAERRKKQWQWFKVLTKALK